MEHEVVNEVANGIVNAAVNPGYDLGQVALGVVGIPIAIIAGYYGLRELYRSKFQLMHNPGKYYARKATPRVFSNAIEGIKNSMEISGEILEANVALAGTGNNDADRNANRTLRRMDRMSRDALRYHERLKEI